jgi:hypothetical protein
MGKQFPEHFWKKLSRLVGPRQANHWMQMMKQRRAPRAPGRESNKPGPLMACAGNKDGMASGAALYGN